MHDACLMKLCDQCRGECYDDDEKLASLRAEVERLREDLAECRQDAGEFAQQSQEFERDLFEESERRRDAETAWRAVSDENERLRKIIRNAIRRMESANSFLVADLRDGLTAGEEE